MIRTKAEFYKAQAEDRCGNHFPHWFTYQDLLESGYSGIVSVRDLKSGRRKITKEMYRFEVEDIPESLRCKDALVGFFPSPPDSTITFQGEYSENGGISELRYSHAKMPMLRAFEQQSIRATGWKARMLVQKYMDDASLRMLHHLVEEHTDVEHSSVDTPVVEFTCFGIAVGVFELNTIFWEVRNY